MITVLYRITSGEVLKISTKGQAFPDINPMQFAVLTDPDLPDGSENVESDNPHLRVLGFQKIADPENNIVRDASQAELDLFSQAEIEDDDMMDKLFARVFMNDHPRFKKLMKATVKVLVDEINNVRREVRLEPKLDDYEVRKRIKDRIKSDFE
jgi:hypothetical protein